MSRDRSANNASKGVGGSGEFSGADCRKVAAVIRAALGTGRNWQMLLLLGALDLWTLRISRNVDSPKAFLKVCKGTSLTVHLRTEFGLTVPFPNFFSSALVFLQLF